MKKTLYVILRDFAEDAGDGCSSAGWNEFLGIVQTFETARNVIEYLADETIGEIIEEDWNTITVDIDDYQEFTFHFKRVEVEV